MTKFWYKWQDDETREVYGESDLYSIATMIAQRLANDDLLDGESRGIEIYQMPEDLLVARCQKGRELEEIISIAEAVGHPRNELHSAPAIARLRGDWQGSNSINDLRSQAGLPRDAWYTKYFVVETPDGFAGFSKDQEEAASLAKRHEPSAVRDSRTWEIIEL